MRSDPDVLFRRHLRHHDLDALGTLFDLWGPRLLPFAARDAPTADDSGADHTAEDTVVAAFFALIEACRAAPPAGGVLATLITAVGGRAPCPAAPALDSNEACRLSGPLPHSAHLGWSGARCRLLTYAAALRYHRRFEAGGKRKPDAVRVPPAQVLANS